MRTRSLNEAAFDTVSPIMCYWTGWVASDGSISTHISGSPYLRLAVTLSDRWAVDEFQRFLGSNHRSRHVRYQTTTKDQLSVNICSRRLVEALARLGVTKEKSKALSVCPDLAQSPDFWRGMLDGDGCIHVDKTGYLHVVLVSPTQDILHQYTDFVLSVTGKRPNVVTRPAAKSGNPYFRINVYGSAARALLDAVGYTDLIKPALPRKREKALGVLAAAA